MTKSTFILAASALALAACSKEEDYPGGSTQSVEASVEASAEASTGAAPAEMAAADPANIAAQASDEAAPVADRAEIPVTLPSMAYVYDYGFSLPGEEIAPLQTRHADMCEALGPSQCMIVGLTASGNEYDEASGRLELAVASDRARGFVSELSTLAEAFHGEQVSANITGEDLSKIIVDTEAHLRAREELRDRLLEVLQTRRGSVAELVEAERSVAAINQEIDQARSWMAEMQGRVSFSRVVLNYQSSTPVGSDFMAPVRGALGSVGSILGIMLAIVIVLGVVGLPIAGMVMLVRRLRRQWVVKAVTEA